MKKLNICKELFEDWNSSGVLYCHWKGTANIEKGFTGTSDLDIFVDPKDNEKAASILRRHNFIRFYTQWGLRYPFIQDWLGLDKDTGVMVHVHYHNRMIVGQTGVMEYSYPWEEDVLAERIYDPKTGIFIINHEYEALTFYTRLGLEFPNKKLKRIAKGQYSFNEEASEELEYLHEHVDKTKLRELFNKYFYSDGEKLFDFYLEPDLSKKGLSTLSRVTKNHIPHNGLRWINTIKSLLVQATLSYIIPHQSYIFRKKIPYSRKGLLIVFVGQDGSGKSVITRDIHKWLSWKIDNRLLYLGFGKEYNTCGRRLQTKLKDNNSAISRLVRNWLPFHIFLKRSRDTKNELKKARTYVCKGGLAIIDRYPQQVAAGINDGPKVRELLIPVVHNRILKNIAYLYANAEEKNIENAISITPDIVFRLQLSVEESLRRKPSEDRGKVLQKKQIVDSMSFANSVVYNINAEQNYNDELIEIKNLIWENIQRL
jgi:thymidylate kinase